MAVSERNVGLPGGPLGSLAGQDVGLEPGFIGLDEEARDPAVVILARVAATSEKETFPDPLLFPFETKPPSFSSAVMLSDRGRYRLGSLRPKPDLLAPGHGRRQPLLSSEPDSCMDVIASPLDVQDSSELPDPRASSAITARSDIFPAGAAVLLGDRLTIEAKPPEAP